MGRNRVRAGLHVAGSIKAKAPHTAFLPKRPPGGGLITKILVVDISVRFVETVAQWSLERKSYSASHLTWQAA